MNDKLVFSIRSFFGADKASFRQYLRNIITRFKEDSLFQNSIYLIGSTLAMSLFGFVFWIITTRVYTTSQIGFATALISATLLLSNFSLFGFDTGIVRFLPKSEKPNTIINTGIIVVTFITLIISVGYVLLIGHIAPQFDLLRQIPTYGILFAVFMVAVSINSLTDSVFVAYRASKYNFYVYFLFGLTKIILPLFLIRYGTFGIFFAYTGSVIVALCVTFYFMFKKFQYKAQIVVNKSIAKEMSTFSVGNYTATFISTFPSLILPTLIIAKLGPSQSAYFYIASTISALLYGIPQAVALSLLAEGSHNEENLWAFVKSAAKLIGTILAIGIIGFILLGKYVLLIFGKGYSDNSSALLNILALSSIFLGINILGSTVLRIRHQIRTLVIVSVGYLIATMLFIVWWLHYGIMGAGWALLGGQAFMSLEFMFLFFNRKG